MATAICFSGRLLLCLGDDSLNSSQTLNVCVCSEFTLCKSHQWLYCITEIY